MKHATILPTYKTLCGLDSDKIISGWIFVEENMEVSKGQQLSFFNGEVTCETCRNNVKISNKCSECGKDCN